MPYVIVSTISIILYAYQAYIYTSKFVEEYLNELEKLTSDGEIIKKNNLYNFYLDLNSSLKDNYQKNCPCKNSWIFISVIFCYGLSIGLSLGYGLAPE